MLLNLHSSPVFDTPNQAATSTPLYFEPKVTDKNLTPADQPVDWVVVRFLRAAGIRFRDKILKHVEISENAALSPIDKSRTEVDIASSNQMLSDGKQTIRRSVGLSEKALDKWHKDGQRISKTRLRNLNDYYQIPLDKGTQFRDISALLKRLNGNKVVDLAYADAHSNYAVTGQFSYESGESFNSPPAKGGVNAEAAWSVYGDAARGANVSVVSVEPRWQKSHTDFPTNLIGFEAIEDPVLRQSLVASYNDKSESVLGGHGNAGIGIISAPDNGYGATGIVPAASIGLQSSNFSGGACAVITYAALRAGFGGVVHVPLASSYRGDPSHLYYDEQVPLDLDTICFDAIQSASANKVTVVIASGNDDVGLDDPYYGGLFNLALRDSGAIVTGVSWVDIREPYASSYAWGSRIDAHAPGSDLATISINNGYITFAQNSGSTAVIAGAIASIQSIARGVHGITLSTREIRSLIRIEGVAQTGQFDRPIAQLPDILNAAQLGIPRIKALRQRAASTVPPTMLLLD